MAPTQSFTTALDGGEWSVSHSGRALPQEEDPGTHWTGGWMVLRAGLDTEARGKYSLRLPGFEPQLCRL
jgi:hypothetical protein